MSNMAAPSLLMTAELLGYAWRQYAQRLGITDFESLGIRVHYTDADALPKDGPCIIVVPAPDPTWATLLTRQPGSLFWIPSRDVLPERATDPLAADMPVLFWSRDNPDGTKPPVEWQSPARVVFHIDIIATLIFMLTRWEEGQRPADVDVRSRFIGQRSVAFRQGFLDRPIVDEYSLILAAWIQVLSPGWTPPPRRFRVLLSHDMDFPLRQVEFESQSWESALRTAAADMIRRRSPHVAFQRLAGKLGYHVPLSQDDYYRGFLHLMALSEQYGLLSAFYFMASEGGPLDPAYDPRKSPFKEMIAQVQARGFEVGFHAGVYTFDDPARFLAEKTRLAEAVGQPRFGGRQHLLRFRAPDTWRLWEQAGLAYDSSLSYADAEGFRCGTCYDFAPFDLEHNREFTLFERPLVVMEATLLKHHYAQPEQAQARILDLAGRCRRVGGNFTLLWHNSSFSNVWLGWGGIYDKIVRNLAQLEQDTHAN